MNQYSFLDDYSEGGHPKILDALLASNFEQQRAYGHDHYSVQAKALIAQHFSDPQTPIYFVSGGTLANLIIIASALRPHEAIIAADSGHIALREAGAIEATGHKIITVAARDGKLTPEAVAQALARHNHHPHMVKARLVYISNATELGTVYTKKELQALAEMCRANHLLLMLDGARLGVALTAECSDLTLQDVAELTDIFWIGGTKVGALLGEAIVIPNAQLADEFAFHVKQRGAMLAKGRVLGLQFSVLFAEGLFFQLSRYANDQAQRLAQAMNRAGYQLSAPTESNQIFPILPNRLIDTLKQDYLFQPWQTVDAQTSVVRLVTSWATDAQQVSALIQAINRQS